MQSEDRQVTPLSPTGLSSSTTGFQAVDYSRSSISVELPGYTVDRLIF